ncbi:MAG: 3-hydroxyacyl-CoA dehydrogenase NAD-binding domain-containing protein [Candidatus Bathyarchaeota archaeon]
MKIEDIKVIGVIGSGVMGHGIAQVCARSGYDIVLVDVKDEFLKKAMELIRSGPFGLTRLVEKGKIKPEDVDKVISRIKPTTDLNMLNKAQYVIEAIPEDPELKKKVFKQVSEIVSPETIIASNTSSIMITELATAVKRPERFVGMHWFNPAPVMRLIEVIRGTLTSDETFNITVELSKKLDKIPIEASDGPGFFTSRFITNWICEAIRLFELGIAGIKEIDDMCKMAFGFPMGPFELSDLIGLDTMLHVCEYVYDRTKDSRYAAPLILRKLVTAGFLGDPRTKPGSRGGFYDYFKIQKKK